ncbi:MAG TPA: DUF4097 domain-containing protein [Firmicutes bacterium]|nr:DUF4097 domain-containing protein [Bacillota bacterium]
MYKKLLKIGTIVLAVGLILIFASLCAAGFDLERIYTKELDDQSYAIQTEIDQIYLDIDGANIDIIPTDGAFRVDYQSGKDDEYDISETDGQLKIIKTTRGGVIRFSLFDDTPGIQLYVPQDKLTEYELITSGAAVDIRELGFTKLKLSSDGAALSLRGIDADELDVASDGASLKLDSVKTGKLALDCESTAVTLNNLNASDKIEFTASDSTIRLEKLSGESLDLTISSTTFNASGLTLISDTRITASDCTFSLSSLTTNTLDAEIESGFLTLSADSIKTNIDAVDAMVTLILAGTESDYTISLDKTDSLSNISPRDGGFRELTLGLESSSFSCKFDGSGIC